MRYLAAPPPQDETLFPPWLESYIRRRIKGQNAEGAEVEEEEEGNEEAESANAALFRDLIAADAEGDTPAWKVRAAHTHTRAVDRGLS